MICFYDNSMSLHKIYLSHSTSYLYRRWWLWSIWKWMKQKECFYKRQCIFQVNTSEHLLLFIPWDRNIYNSHYLLAIVYKLAINFYCNQIETFTMLCCVNLVSYNLLYNVHIFNQECGKPYIGYEIPFPFIFTTEKYPAWQIKWLI